MKHRFFILILCFLVLTSFITVSETGCKKTGIKGHIYYEAGNQMPSPDEPRTLPAGMKTTLYIYELTNISQVDRDGSSPFYRGISTKMVRKVESKEDGSFKVKLKPGMYSLFVRKGELFYANIYDGENNIYPVRVEEGQMTEVDFKANYDAVY